MSEKWIKIDPHVHSKGISGCSHVSYEEIIDEKMNEFARGISSYNSTDIEKIKGQHSDKITEILGYKFDDDVVIKDNLVLI